MNDPWSNDPDRTTRKEAPTGTPPDLSKPLRIAMTNLVAWIDEEDGGYHHGRLYVQPDGTVKFVSGL